MIIQKGSTVEICAKVPYEEYNLEIGDVGTVLYVASTGKYAVSIPEKMNPHINTYDSRYGEPGFFWIPKKCVKPYFKKESEREDNKMEKLTGYKNIAVIEIDDKDHFYVLYEEDYKPGDQVLVSGNMYQKFYTIKEVLTLEDFKEKYKRQLEDTEPKFTREIISKVDTSAYDLRVANRAKAAELRKEMDKKIAEIDEMRKYTLYAEKCPELAAMLEEYNSLV